METSLPPALGSSPLARGLPEVNVVVSESHRIIPARAGFTTSMSALLVCGADHPRSRGVYVALVPPTIMRPGSSPLARGLRRRPTPASRALRIIPARAGFTQRELQRLGNHPDHPRSRGVYFSLRRPSSRRMGSSPLARGLLQPVVVIQTLGGIIPARAGFTSCLRT